MLERKYLILQNEFKQISNSKMQFSLIKKFQTKLNLHQVSSEILQFCHMVGLSILNLIHIIA